MRGYVLQDKGIADWQDMAVPEIGPYDALVRPTAVATCTTDVHLIETLSLPNAKGKVIGHEGVGVVESIGAFVTDFAPGDRVVLPAGLADWRHPRAQRGEAKFHQSKSPYFSADPGNQGWFAEFVNCHEADSNLAHIPDTVTDIQADSVDDMAATGFTGVERMQIQFGEVVVILGVGPVGLMGGGRRRVTRRRSHHRGRLTARHDELAKQYGATDLVDYKHGDVHDLVMDLTGGVEVDSVLVASGGSASDQISTAMRMTKFGGHVSVVSGFFDDETVTLPMSVCNYGVMEKYLTAAQATQGRDYMERLLLLIANGRLDTAPLATHVLHGWDKVGDSLESMRSREQTRHQARRRRRLTSWHGNIRRHRGYAGIEHIAVVRPRGATGAREGAGQHGAPLFGRTDGVAQPHLARDRGRRTGPVPRRRDRRGPPGPDHLVPARRGALARRRSCHLHTPFAMWEIDPPCASSRSSRWR